MNCFRNLRRRLLDSVHKMKVLEVILILKHLHLALKLIRQIKALLLLLISNKTRILQLECKIKLNPSQKVIQIQKIKVLDFESNSPIEKIAEQEVESSNAISMIKNDNLTKNQEESIKENSLKDCIESLLNQGII